MNFWAWGGKFIGYEQDGILYKHTGEPIGKFYGEELYDFNGKYIGEIKNDKRLIVNLGKKGHVKSCTSKPCSHSAIAPYCDYASYAMYAGYEDFEA